MFKVATVINYLDRTKTAILDLTNELAVGDRVKFMRGEQDLFEQKIANIQDNYEQVNVAKRGDIVVIKVDRQVQKHDEAYKI